MHETIDMVVAFTRKGLKHVHPDRARADRQGHAGDAATNADGSGAGVRHLETDLDT